jgi:hypothetical protein
MLTTRFSRFVPLAVAWLLGAVAVGQQNPNGQLPLTSVGEPYLFLIRDPLVHDELQLTARQRQAVTALNDELDAPFWSMRNKGVEHISKTLTELKAKAETQISSILTAEQLQRLGQIELWTQGPNAFMEDDFCATLSLADEQRVKIREIVTKTREAVVDLGKQLQSGEAQEALERRARRLRTDEQRSIVATLTRRQQQRWLELLGERVDISKLGRVKFKAPELAGGEWINSSPLTLEQLRGKVVGLHFYAFG